MGLPARWPTLSLGLLVACTEPDGGKVRDAGEDGESAGGSGGESGADTGADSGADSGDLLLLDAPRELRGAWVATVWNINFPSTSGAAAQQEELAALVDVAEAAGLNALYFQVRPEGDALYESTIEPWSRFLTGEQGRDPGYDPLQVLLDLAHPRGIEVHAWLNPYRALATNGNDLDAAHFCAEVPGDCVDYGSYLWMDPGSAAVQANTRAVAVDLATRYAIDGVHFDDYFYPYPDGTDFPDAARYAAYVAGGGTLDLADWRRANVNQLIGDLSAELAEAAPAVSFGVAPFGIYRPGVPEGISGFDAYAGLYADPVAWAQAGWLDYLAPQLYWPTTQTAQAYETLLAWWTTVEGPQVIYAGNYLSQLGSSSSWTVEEFEQQVAISRSYEGSLGNIWYNVDPLVEDRDGIRGALARLYAAPAIPPATARVDRTTLASPVPTLDGGSLSVDAGDAWRWALYDGSSGAWTLRSLHAPDEAVTLSGSGPWAVSGIYRGSVESPARTVP